MWLLSRGKLILLEFNFVDGTICWNLIRLSTVRREINHVNTWRGIVSRPHVGIGTSKLFHRTGVLTARPVKYFTRLNSVVGPRNNYFIDSGDVPR